MDVFARIERMRPWIAQGDWVGLERAYADDCRLVAPQIESRVSGISLSAYTATLRGVLAGLPDALDSDVEAVYWEFDIDNRWSSAFFFCNSYTPESGGDDEWAADFDLERVVRGPDMVDLARSQPTTWDGDEMDAAANAYLVARTISSFGRAATGWTDDRPLCAGYHDQSLAFRIAGSSW